MNSFGHYAFGSVAEWMFSYGLGIDSEDYGYHIIIIKPAISKEVDFMKESYESINGNVTSSCRWKGNNLLITIKISVNMKVRVHIPIGKVSDIKDRE